MRKTVVFIDYETGGTRPEHPDIQLAAVAVKDWVELGAFQAKIQFEESDCDPEALAMNSYDPAIWKQEALPEKVVVAQFGQFLRPYGWIQKVAKRTGRAYGITRLAGHRAASFDAPRLMAMFKRHGAFLAAAGYEPLDTWQLALWWFDVDPEMRPETPPKNDIADATLLADLLRIGRLPEA